MLRRVRPAAQDDAGTPSGGKAGRGAGWGGAASDGAPCGAASDGAPCGAASDGAPCGAVWCAAGGDDEDCDRAVSGDATLPAGVPSGAAASVVAAEETIRSAQSARLIRRLMAALYPPSRGE